MLLGGNIFIMMFQRGAAITELLNETCLRCLIIHILPRGSQKKITTPKYPKQQSNKIK